MAEKDLKIIEKAYLEGDADRYGEIMAGLLMDENISTYKMFDDLASNYVYAEDHYGKDAANAYRAGMDYVLSTITYKTLSEIAKMGIEKEHHLVSDRFELVENDDPDGYNGLGSGYVYIMDTFYEEPVHDENGILITFDVEEGDTDKAFEEAETYVKEHYHMLKLLSSDEYNTEREEI